MTRERARALRKSTTALEQRAWSLLRRLRDEGIAVRRQHPIGQYVADFAIMRARVAIEIDGPLHEAPERKLLDQNRDADFATLGWCVLRFTSKQLEDELAFLAAIRAVSTPSPRGEGAGGGVNPDGGAKGSAPDHSEGASLHPAPQPPPLAGRGSPPPLGGSEGEFAPHLQRRTRANRKLPPRRKT